MRLLNAWTLKIEEFGARKTPPYAILSHTWGEGEVLLQDIQAGREKALKGYPKIAGCCKQAREDGFEHVVSLGTLDERGSIQENTHRTFCQRHLTSI